MSEVLPHRHVTEGATTRLSYGSPVTVLDFGEGSTPPRVHLQDGRAGLGTCLGCSEPPCLQRLAAPHSTSPVLPEFPQDPIEDLCPTEAIQLDVPTATVSVESDTCIGCGLCVVRCPYGAIHLAEDGKAAVLLNGSDLVQPDRTDTAIVDTAERRGKLGPLNSPALAEVPAAVARLHDAVQQRLVANLFSFLGVDAKVRRRGDTNIRFDGVLGFPNGQLGVMEIELSPNAVESPRALIEDIAVLHSRYHVPTNEVYAISVLLQLPNARSEYYQVMQDIEKVLAIRCRTITVGALLAMVWNIAKLPDLGELFLTTEGGTDLTPSLAAVIGNVEHEPYAAAFINAK